MPGGTSRTVGEKEPILPETLAGILDKVRRRQPVVHAITNWVTAGDVANLLQVIGARPILAFAQEEVVEIVSAADALVLNLGTPSPDRVTATLLAGRRANVLGKPIILDPVGVGASKFRTDAIARILSEVKVSVIRGNRAEVGTLAGTAGKLRGIDAVTGPANIEKAAQDLSRKSGAVIAATGELDLIVEKERMAVVRNGHPWMGQVTGTGCMLTAMIAAFAAVEKDLMAATLSAVASFGVAGEDAGRLANGPGSFKAALLDALFKLRADDLQGRIRMEE